MEEDNQWNRRWVQMNADKGMIRTVARDARNGAPSSALRRETPQPNRAKGLSSIVSRYSSEASLPHRCSSVLIRGYKWF
jgi:hypothetical protein